MLNFLKKKRYFFVSFDGSNDEKNGLGTITFNTKDSRFPSNSGIIKMIADYHGINEKDVIILNIFEFNSKRDFEEFTKD